MKKYIPSIKIVALILVLEAAASVFAGVPLFRIWQQKKKPVETEKTTGLSMGEELALKKLLKVFSRMSEVETLYATGSFNAVDPSDPDNKLGTTFIYSQDKEQLYYRIGNQEVIALADIYIAVNHDIKKIFVSEAKTILPPMQMPVDSLLRLWKNENYTVSETTADSLTTVDLRCDNHITCKEYKAVYDAEKQYVTSVYMRLTNLDDPFNDKMDKQLTVSFSRWEEGKVPPALFDSSRYIRNEQGVYLPAARLKGYELMTSF